MWGELLYVCPWRSDDHTVGRNSPHHLTFDLIIFKLFFLLTLLCLKSVRSVLKDAPVQRWPAAHPPSTTGWSPGRCKHLAWNVLHHARLFSSTYGTYLLMKREEWNCLELGQPVDSRSRLLQKCWRSAHKSSSCLRLKCCSPPPYLDHQFKIHFILQI